MTVLLLASACSRVGANRDSLAADSLKAAAAGATTSPMARPVDTPAKLGTSAAPQRPSPRDTRPTPPKVPVHPPASAGIADTARGTPAVVGTSFQKHVVLQRSGTASVRLAGPQAELVGAQSGADVWVSGTRDATGTLTVTRFVVRSVDGAPAIDGILRADGNGLAIVTPDGARHPIASAPDALRQHVGSRVWVTGAASGPVVFGVIDKSP